MGFPQPAPVAVTLTDPATVGTVRFGDGTAAAPSIAFASQPSSGFYLTGNGPAVSASGVNKLSFGVTAISIADGVNLDVQTTTGSKIGVLTTVKLAFWASTPVVQAGSTSDLRMALINAGIVATGGATPLDLNAGGLTASKTTVTGAAGTARQHRFQTAGVDRWIVQATSTAEGGANAGSDLAFLARDDTGAALSTPISIIRSTGIITYSGVQLGPAGSVTAPTWSFSAETGLGVFRSAAGSLAVASGGAATMVFTGGGTFLTDGLVMAFGSTSGSKIASATTQKIGLWNTTPIVQPARAGQLTDNSGGTSGGNTIAAIVSAVDPTAAGLASTQNAIATLAARLNLVETKLSAAGGGVGVTA